MYPTSYEDLRRTYQNKSDLREAFNPVLSPKANSAQFKVGDALRSAGGLGLGMGGSGGTIGNNNNNNNRGNFGSRIKLSNVSIQNSTQNNNNNKPSSPY